MANAKPWLLNAVVSAAFADMETYVLIVMRMMPCRRNRMLLLHQAAQLPKPKP